MAEPLTDFELLLRSRHGLIVIDTLEDDRAVALVRAAAQRASLPLFLWSRTKGLRRDGADLPVYGTTDPDQALAHIASAQIDALYYLVGAEALLGDATLVERLRDVATAFNARTGAGASG